MTIRFKIYQGDKNIILGIKWLEKVKPYNLDNEQLIIHYENKKPNWGVGSGIAPISSVIGRLD